MRRILAAEHVNLSMNNLLFATNVILVREYVILKVMLLTLHELGDSKQHGIKSLSSANTICDKLLDSVALKKAH